MNPADRRTDLPVLLLHNLDQSWSPEETTQTLHEVSTLETAIRQEGHPVVNVAVRHADLRSVLTAYDPEEYVVLNWCEDLPGHPHSDMLVAETLEKLNFAYTGSPPSVLALSWDKARVKTLLQQGGVSTPRWAIYHTEEISGWELFPAIVKPAREHCSIGVDTDAVVLGGEQLRARVRYVLETFHQPALVEDFIDGREFHVSLFGDGPVLMLPPAEMDFGEFSDVRDRLCTFDSKFVPGSPHYDKIRLQLPARLQPAERDALEEAASAAYRVIGCRDYARIDIRLRGGVFHVLDINPNADIGYETSIACAAESAGFSYGSIMSYLVNLAARRHPRFGGRACTERKREESVETL